MKIEEIEAIVADKIQEKINLLQLIDRETVEHLIEKALDEHCNHKH